MGITRHRQTPRRISQLIFITLLGATLPLLSGCDWIDIVSLGQGGVPANASSYRPSISADGRLVVFQSEASNLVPGDTNGEMDSFLYDTVTKEITRVGVGNNGEQADSGSGFPRISGNGRYVVFSSSADNLVDDDTNGAADVFLRDLQEGTTTRASINSSGEQGDALSVAGDISHDGQRIVFQSIASNFDSPEFTPQLDDIYLHDRPSGTTTRISVGRGGWQANSTALRPRISPDGGSVAFESNATNLVHADTNGTEIFVYDVDAGTINRVCVNDSGAQGNNLCYYPDFSHDGRFITFWSPADNLVPNDTNNEADIFVRDQVSGTTTRVSVDSTGAQAEPAWYTTSSPSISADGRFVAFTSSATLEDADLFNGWNDVYVHDRETGNTTLVSENHETLGFGHSRQPDISADGLYIAFHSWAENLVPGDTNAQGDIFIKRRPGLAITSVVPEHLPTGATTAVTITGSNFLTGANVEVEFGTVSNIVVVDENTITAEVTVLPEQAAGAADVRVYLYGGATGLLTGALALCENCVSYQ
jgi:Tol biopolymer transport system component